MSDCVNCEGWKPGVKEYCHCIRDFSCCQKSVEWWTLPKVWHQWICLVQEVEPCIAASRVQHWRASLAARNLSLSTLFASKSFCKYVIVAGILGEVQCELQPELKAESYPNGKHNLQVPLHLDQWIPRVLQWEVLGAHPGHCSGLASLRPFPWDVHKYLTSPRPFLIAIPYSVIWVSQHSVHLFLTIHPFAIFKMRSIPPQATVELLQMARCSPGESAIFLMTSLTINFIKLLQMQQLTLM